MHACTGAQHVAPSMPGRGLYRDRPHGRATVACGLSATADLLRRARCNKRVCRRVRVARAQHARQAQRPHASQRRAHTNGTAHVSAMCPCLLLHGSLERLLFLMCHKKTNSTHGVVVGDGCRGLSAHAARTRAMAAQKNTMHYVQRRACDGLKSPTSAIWLVDAATVRTASS